MLEEIREIVHFAMQIILEGMGRALHTNFNARFKCEALKVWLCDLVSLLEYKSWKQLNTASL